MNRIAHACSIAAAALLLLASPAAAQLSGIYTIDPSQPAGGTNYQTFTAAVTDLNTSGVGAGGATFNVAAGSTFTERPPALTATGTAANPIVFVKSGTGANPIVVPASPGTRTPATLNWADGIIRIVGGDYITFDGIDVKDDTTTYTTTGTRSEYGYLLTRASATDGCQYVTIRNCTVTLARTDPFTCGVYVSNCRNGYVSASSDTTAAGITITAESGRSQGIKVYGVTTVNCHIGVMLRGYAHGSSPYNLYDHFNEIGKDGANNVSGFGWNTAPVYGVYTYYQDSLTIANTTVAGGQGCTTTMYGIFNNQAYNAFQEVYNNTVTFTNTVATTASIYGYYIYGGYSGTSNTASFYNNAVTDWQLTGFTSGTVYCMYINGSAYALNVYDNRITNCQIGSSSATSTGTIYGISTPNSNTNAGSVYNVYNNLVRGVTRVQSTAGSATSYGLYLPAYATTSNQYNNVVANNTFPGTGSTYLLYTTGGSTSYAKNVYGNRLDTLLNGSTSSYGLYQSGGAPAKVYKNTIRNLTCGVATGTLYGLYLTNSSSGQNTYAYNNYVSDLKVTAAAPSGATSPQIAGIYNASSTAGVNMGVFYNTVHLNATGSGTSFATAALYTNVTSNLDLRNNILVNASTPGSAGRTVAIWRSGTTYTTYASTSNNNDFYAGAPDATHLINYDGTNSDQTLAAYKSRVTPKDNVSYGSNPPFLNVATAPYNLHIDPTVTTPLESGGAAVTSPAIDDDFDADIRFGSTGYAGLGTAPDIGADEGDFTAFVCSGTPSGGVATVLPNAVCTGVAAMIDASGASTDPGTTFQWQESDDNGVADPWADVTTGSGGTTITYTAAPYTAPIWYRCRVTCTYSAQTSYSTSVQLKAGLSGSYTINAAVPTGGTNFQSFTDAFNHLATFGACGPVLLEVASGSGPYTEQLSIGNIRRPVYTDTVSVKGNGNTLQCTPTASNFTVVDVYGTHHVALNDLTIKGLSPTYGIGVALRGSSKNITIRNCTIDLSAVTSTTGANSAGIAFTASTTSNSSGGDNADSCLITGNAIKGGAGGGPYYGIYLAGTASGSTSNDYNKIRSNIIEDFYNRGIYNSQNAYTTVTGNIFRRPTRSSVTDFYAMYVINGNRGDVIEKNIITNPFGGAPTSTGAFYGFSYATPNIPSGTESVIRNNVFYNINGEGTQYFFYFSYAQNLRIYNNTINSDNTASTGSNTVYVFYYSGGTATPGADTKNNTVCITRGGTSTRYIFYNSGTVPLVSNYNNLYFNTTAGTNYTGYYNSTSYATLANWQTANASAYDQQSISADPVYENLAAGNCRPQSSAVNDLGTNLSGITPAYTAVTDDILGAARAVPPDMGAWEFTPAGMTLTNVAATQTATSAVPVGGTNQQVIGVQFQALGALTPLTLTQLDFSTNGSTSAADIANAKLWYTGSSPVFATTTQWGSTVASPSGAFSFTGSTALSPGFYYFWLTYDIAAAATPCDVVDAECTLVTAGTGFTPTPSAPAGNRMIKAALSGTYTVNSAGTPSCTAYTSIREAAADVTNLGVAGPVTFDVAAGHTETSANILVQTATANATNTITFQKSGSGANPLVTAAAGTGSMDGIIKIAGTDYVTFDGIDVAESGTNAGATQCMEWGYAVLKASATDGAQHVTIRNCAITMTRAYTSNTGIYQNNITPTSTASLTIATTGGRTEYTSYYNLAISNVTTGILALGYADGTSPYTYYDQNLDVGYGGGNTIAHGGNAGTAYGVYTQYINNTRITGNSFPRVFNHSSGLYGVYSTTAYNANIEISNNLVQIADSATGGSSMYGIYNSGGASGLTNTVKIYGNVVNCLYPTNTSGAFYGIYSSSGGYLVNVYGNTVSNCTIGSSTATSTGSIYLLYSISSPTTTAGSAQHVYGNTVWNNSRVQSTLGSGTNYTFYVSGSADTTEVQANTINNNILTSSSTAYHMYFPASGSTKRVFDNTSDTASYGTTTYGLYQTSGTNCSYYRNRLANITMTSTAAVLYGFYATSGTTLYFYNNQIADLKTPNNTSSPGIYGAYISGVTTTYFFDNTVYLNDAHSAATFGSSALYASSSYTLDLRNTILVNTSTPGTTSGNTVAFHRSSTTLTSYASASNSNLLYAGTPATNRLLFYDGTNAVQTIAAYRALVAPRDNLSVTENPPFVAAATPVDLHLSTTTPTVAEGGGVPVTSPIAITQDFDGNARDASYPDIGMDEFAGTANDVLPPAISYTPLTNGVPSTSRLFQNVTATDRSGIDGASGTRPRCYYKKGNTTNSNLWNDNTSATTGWKWVEANGSSSPFDFTLDYAKLYGGSVSVGDTVQYFVVAQDLAATPNVAIQAGAFAAAPAGVALTSAAFPIGGTINSYIIGNGMAGAYTVPGSYPSLTGSGGLFAAINSSVVTGNITVSIADSLTEDGTNALNQFSEDPPNSNYTMSIAPGAAVERVVYGSVAQAMIRLNGADRITIDGRSGGSGQYLRFVNTNTANGVFSLAGDATGNTIRNAIIEGASTTTANALLVFGTGTTTGNSGNQVQECLFRPLFYAAGSSTPYTMVYSSGTAGTMANAANTVANCVFVNPNAYGIYLTGTGNGNGWNLSGNNFYNTTPPLATLYCMNVIPGTAGSGYTINDNDIGGSDTLRGGAPMTSYTSGVIYGIYTSLGNAFGMPSSIRSNRISNIANTYSTGSSMIAAAGAGKVDILNNTVGGLAAPSDTLRVSYDTDLILCSSSDTVRIENNLAAYATYWRLAGDRLIGISNTGTGRCIIRNNEVHHLASNTTNVTLSSYPVMGIRSTGAALLTIEGNSVHDIRSMYTDAVSAAWGIGISAAASGSSVARNRIHTITADNATAGWAGPAVYGFQITGGGPVLVTNNMVSLGATVGNDARLRGIEDSSTTANRYHYNSVVITGAASSSSVGNTYAFRHAYTAANVLRNNAFVNNRETGGGAGTHYAAGATNVTGWSGNANPALVSSNHNFFAAPDATRLNDWGGTATSFIQWRSQPTNNDLYSVSVPTASTSTSTQLYAPDLFTSISSGDLDVRTVSQTAWFLQGNGVAGAESDTAASDFDAINQRSTTLGYATDIGADEFVPGTAPYSATETGNRVTGGISSYIFAGRTLADIYWQNAGTVPTAVDFVPSLGVNPPGAATGNYSNGYHNVTATGGGGYLYNIKLYFMPSILGSISSPANIRMAKRDGGVWTAFDAGSNCYLNLAGGYVETQNLAGFSDFALTDSIAPLPVELAALTAVLRGPAVELGWKTASELNLARFVVERSADGGAWTGLGAVDARGTSDRPAVYAFTDGALPAARELAYRLRMEERDGRMQYSPQVRVALERPAGFTVYGNYPNPFNPGTTISFAIPGERQVTVKVFDLAGREVAVLLSALLPAGAHSVLFTAGGLPSGVYRYVVTAGDQQQSRMMLFTR